METPHYHAKHTAILPYIIISQSLSALRKEVPKLLYYTHFVYLLEMQHLRVGRACR